MRRVQRTAVIAVLASILLAVIVLTGVVAPDAQAQAVRPGGQIIGTLTIPRLRLVETPPPFLVPPENLFPDMDLEFVIPTPEPQPDYASCGDSLEGITWTRVTAPPSEFGACYLTILGSPGSTISFSVNPVTPGALMTVQLFNNNGEELDSGQTDSPESPVVITYTTPPDGQVTLAVSSDVEAEFEIRPQRVWYAISISYCGGELEAGETRAAILPSGQAECWYTYEGQQGRILTVTMITDSDELDPLLRLYDESGNTVGSDDDSGGGKNAALVVALPASEEFTIVARDYNRSAGGPFEIAASDEAPLPTSTPRPPTPFVPPPTMAPPACGGNIQVGATTAGRIQPATAKCVYAFSGSAGQRVKIDAVRTGGNLDTYLELWGSNYPSGTRLNFNDDSSAVGRPNSQIANYRLPSAGTYKIVVSSYRGQTSGQYLLTLSRP